MKTIERLLAAILLMQWLTLCVWFYWLYLEPEPAATGCEVETMVGG